MQPEDELIYVRKGGIGGMFCGVFILFLHYEL